MVVESTYSHQTRRHKDMAGAAAGASALGKWKKAKRHEVTLASGTVVEIELPNLPALIKGGEIPNTLLDVAIAQQKLDAEITPEQIKEQFVFYRFLVAKTVVSPEITEDDVEELPYEDVEMLVEFATRQRD